MSKWKNTFSEVDYYTNQNPIDTFLEKDYGVEINIVMSSSIGGFAAYPMADALNRPALLFNAALMKRSVPQNIPSANKSCNTLKQILIGQRDEVVLPADTLHFLSEDFNLVTDVTTPGARIGTQDPG